MSDGDSIQTSRLRRDGGGLSLDRVAAAWRQRRVRWSTYGLAIVLLAGFSFWFAFARGLPSAEMLSHYQPPLPTNVRALDGEPVRQFARERRVYLTFEELPPRLVQAFISAEDKTFFQHGGLDYPGIASAVLTNLRNDGRPVGASTITQQVAKNLLLDNELSYVRKIREAILAKRIESTFTKEQILQLYLNQIFLGRNAYGVQAASRAYFDKDLGDLSLAEIAFLAVLPKAPSNYTPNTERGHARALERRDWILGQMADNGYITAAERDAARAQPLVAIRPSEAKVTAPERGSSRTSAASSSTASARMPMTGRTASMPADCGCAPRSTCASRKRRKRRCATGW